MAGNIPVAACTQSKNLPGQVASRWGESHHRKQLTKYPSPQRCTSANSRN